MLPNQNQNVISSLCLGIMPKHAASIAFKAFSAKAMSLKEKVISINFK